MYPRFGVPMKKTMLFLFALLSLNAFAQDLSVNVIEFTNATNVDRYRVDRAMELIHQVVNSEDFRNRILNMTYKLPGSDLPRKGYTQTNHTPKKILENIIKAEENYPGGKPQQMDLFLDMFYEESTTIGYTDWNDKYVHMNRYFHDAYTPVQTSGNLFHEWLHKLSYDHSVNYNDSRPHSVPYKIGYLMADMAAELESHGDLLAKEMMLKSFTEAMDNCSHNH